MNKYQPLERHLEKIGNEFIPMTFLEIESVIDDALPPSARKHRPWWSNNPSNSTITHSWLGAGYKTGSVDLEKEKLVFRRNEAIPAKEIEILNGTHPLFGKLNGQITITGDFDISEPTGAEWEAVKE